MCISAYHGFMNKTETAAVLTGLGGIIRLKCHGQGSHVLLIFKFPDKYFDFSLINLMYATCPTYYAPYEVHILQSHFPPSKKETPCVT